MQQKKKVFRGESFKDEDLSNADFSDADLRSTDFTGAILTGANFTGAKCGLQRRWLILLTALCSLLAAISVLFLIFAGVIVSRIFRFSGLEHQIGGWASLIVLTIFLIVIISKGIITGAATAAVAFVVTVAFTFIFTRTAAITVASAVAFAGIEVVTATVIGTIAVTVAVVLIGKKPVTIAFTGVSIFLLVPVIAAFTGEGTVEGTAVALVIPVVVAFASAFNHIGWRAMRGDKRDTWVRSIAIAFTALRGTSFRNADLSEANFSQAILKSTDFRESNLTRTCWQNTRKLDRVRPGNTYLKSAVLRHLLITGDGQKQNYDRQDLRGVNLSGANLENASFVDADFYQADLQGANLSRAILVRSNFERADLRNANLTGSCIQDWVITESTKLNRVICDYVYLKWVDGDKRDQMPPRGKFKPGGFVTFVRYILETVELYHEKDINPRLALTVLQKMSRDYDEPFDIVALGKKGERIFVQVKVSENIARENFKDDYYHRYDNDLKLWSGGIHKLPPSVNSFIEKKISEIASEKTDDFVFVDVTHVEGNYTEINQGKINMTGDRNIKINQGNYNENIEGDYYE